PGKAGLPQPGVWRRCRCRCSRVYTASATHAAIEEFEQGQALRRLVDVAAAKAGQRSVELSGG
ncbi:MAG: hypothetical protein ACFNYG_10710, partial [Lautropia mirabilis]